MARKQDPRGSSEPDLDPFTPPTTTSVLVAPETFGVSGHDRQECWPLNGVKGTTRRS